MKNIGREIVEKQKEELGRIKFIIPILPYEAVLLNQEKLQFLPPVKFNENTGCMSGN